MYFQAIIIKKWMLTMLCLCLVACGGSKDFQFPEEAIDTTAPLIESFLPDETTSSSFEVDYKVEIIFSELMNTDSLDLEEGLKLYSGKRDQDSGIDLEPRNSIQTFSVVPLSSRDAVTDKEIQIPATKVILSPESGRFALNTDYTVTVDYPARDLVLDDPDTSVDERNYVTGANSVSFTTEKGEWKSSKFIPNIAIQNEDTPQETIDLRDNNQYKPTVISNIKGNTFVFWRQELSPGITQLWVTRYDIDNKKFTLVDNEKQVCSGELCANAIQINSTNSTNVIDYHASINESGQLAVVWSQANQPGDYVSIWANLFDGAKWLGANEIAKTGFDRTGHADLPQIAIDQKGNVVSVWREEMGQYSRIKTNIYALGDNLLMKDGQWSEPPSFIDSSSQVISRPPKLTIGKDGLVIAVWSQKSTSNFYIYSNRLRLGQDEDWLIAERIDNIAPDLPEYEIGDATLPIVAIDQNNDAIAVWVKHDGQRNNLWYNRFTGSWGGQADYVEKDRLGDAAYPSLTFSRSNKALLAWNQENKSTKTKSLVTSFFNVNSATGWEAQEVIETSSLLEKPTVAFDTEGNAIVLWQENLTKSKLKVSYYSKLTDSWEEPLLIGSLVNDLSVAPLYEDGRFLSVWETEDNSDFKLKSVLFSD